MVVSQNKGTPIGPQNITILIIGTLQKVPLILGNYHIMSWQCYAAVMPYLDPRQDLESTTSYLVGTLCYYWVTSRDLFKKDLLRRFSQSAHPKS